MKGPRFTRVDPQKGLLWGGHEQRSTRLGLSGCFRLSKRTFAGTPNHDAVTPKAVARGNWTEVGKPPRAAHGTTTLFAALDVLEGRIIGQCMACHRHQEKINRETPAGRELNLIVDRYLRAAPAPIDPKDG